MADPSKIALLIDADNTQPQKMDAVVEELAKHGKIIVRRAYANWSKEAFKGWDSVAQRLSIRRAQQDDFVTGKNASDIALTIDAVELLHENICGTFAIVSSDSDFTPLTLHLREAGIRVFGFVRKQAAEAYRNSFQELLFFLEDLPSRQEQEPSQASSALSTSAASALPPKLHEVHQALRAYAEANGDEEGYVSTGAAANHLHTLFPKFKVRGYGAASMTTFCKKNDKLYEVKKVGEGTAVIAYFRVKREDTPKASPPQPAQQPAQQPAPPAPSPRAARPAKKATNTPASPKASPGKASRVAAQPKPREPKQPRLNIPAEELHRALSTYARKHANAEGFAYAPAAATHLAALHPGKKLSFDGSPRLLTFLETHRNRYGVMKVPQGVACGIYYRCIGLPLPNSTHTPQLPGLEL